MKNIYFLLAILLCFSSIAQQNIEEKENIETQFACDIIKIDKDILVLKGNVNFKTDIIEIDNAKKAIFNKITKELIVKGLDQFEIDGAIQIKDKGKKKVLHYTVGERVAYLE